MNLTLRKDWQDFVDDLVEKGRFGSAEEVIGEALRVLRAREAKLAVDAEFRQSLSSAEEREEQRNALRLALIEGEESGPASPFDFDAFLARKRRSATEGL